MAEREVVVVTGASAGIGRAIALEFARHGAAVGLIARGRAGLEAAAAEVAALGGTAYAHSADVADFEALNAAADAVEEVLGPIDIWVNNAMTTVFSFFDDIEPAEYERATRVTYLGTVWGTKVALSGCCRETAARSSRSARRWPIAASRCRRPTAAPSTRSRASRSRCAASCATAAAEFTPRWCSFRG